MYDNLPLFASLPGKICLLIVYIEEWLSEVN